MIELPAEQLVRLVYCKRLAKTRSCHRLKGVHVPDGFLDAPTSLTTGAAAAAVVAVALRQARTELDDRTAPLAGLTAAFVFAGQMINFPVGAGTSGHLIGATLAAVLVGPWTGILCISVVLAVQALLFADGGLTALGTNILLMAVVAGGVGWLMTQLVLRFRPDHPRSVSPAAFVGGLISVPIAALAFTGLYAVGGATEISLTTLASAMVGWHLLIGVGEAIITALTVGSVIAVRPDLVYAARRLLPAPELRYRPAAGAPPVPSTEGAER